jgi:hypothetical protein
MGGIRRQTELTLMCSISHAGFLTSTRHPSSHSSREVTYPALRTAPLVAALAVVALIPEPSPSPPSSPESPPVATSPIGVVVSLMRFPWALIFLEFPQRHRGRSVPQGLKADGSWRWVGPGFSPDLPSVGVLTQTLKPVLFPIVYGPAKAVP